MAKKLLLFGVLTLLLATMVACIDNGDDSKEVVVTSSSVSLRKWPNLKTKAVADIPEGTRLPFLGSFGKFYKTKYEGEEGYVLKSLTKLEDRITSSSTTTTTTTVKPQPSAGNTYVYVDGYHVRLRLGPSTSYPYLTNRYGGTVYAPRYGRLPYLGREGNFYKVSYSGGIYYISCDFTHLVTQ